MIKLRVKKRKQYQVLDLFSGIGGFGYGLQLAGMNVQAFCEINVYQQKVLNKHWSDVPIYCDIQELNGEYLRENFPELDVFCGGFPCTDISVAGKHDGGLDGKDSGLWYEYRRLIKEYLPRIAVIENVSGLRGRGLTRILQDLAQIGYDATWTLFDSQYFGVPQRRRRIYIVAVRDGIPAYADFFQFEERNKKTCREQVGLINKSREWLLHEGKKEWSHLAYFTKQSHGEYSEKGVSGTILKRDTADLISDNGRLRRVMPKERMLLQGFPEDWLIDSTLKDMFTASGMTVPVVKYIGERIIHANF